MPDMPPAFQQDARALLVGDAIRQVPDLAQQHEPVAVDIEALHDLGDGGVLGRVLDDSQRRGNVRRGELAALGGDEVLQSGRERGRVLEELHVQAGDHGVKAQAESSSGGR